MVDFDDPVIKEALKHEKVPDWREIMALGGSERDRAFKNAAWHVWMFLRSTAIDDKRGQFQDAWLATVSGRAVWSGNEGNGIYGWRWNGIMGIVYDAFWLELSSLKKSNDGLPATQDQVDASVFRIYLSKYLASTKNVVCVYRGSMRSSPPRLPEWFVRREWNPDPPVLAYQVRSRKKRELAMASQPLLEQEQEAVTDLAPAQVPEPAQVQAQLTPNVTCRVTGCGRSYRGARGEANRDAHERRDHPALVLQGGPSCEFCGDGPFKNERGRNIHYAGCRKHHEALLAMGKRQAGERQDGVSHSAAITPQARGLTAPSRGGQGADDDHAYKLLREAYNEKCEEVRLLKDELEQLRQIKAAIAALRPH